MSTTSLHSSPLHPFPAREHAPAHRSRRPHEATGAATGVATVLWRLPGALLAVATASVDGRAAMAAVDPASAAPRHQLRS